MSSEDFVKMDLLEWIKDFEGDAALYRNLGEGDIKFDFKKHDTEELCKRLWSKRGDEGFKQLPDLVQTKVNKVSSAASMLFHEVCYETNFTRSSRNKEGPDVTGKRNLLYKAIADLLSPHHYFSSGMTEKEMDDSKSWIEDNLLATLLDPSDSAPASSATSEPLKTSFISKAAEELVQGTRSFVRSLFGITATKSMVEGLPPLIPRRQQLLINPRRLPSPPYFPSRD